MTKSSFSLFKGYGLLFVCATKKKDNYSRAFPGTMNNLEGPEKLQKQIKNNFYRHGKNSLNYLVGEKTESELLKMTPLEFLFFVFYFPQVFFQDVRYQNL